MHKTKSAALAAVLAFILIFSACAPAPAPEVTETPAVTATPAPVSTPESEDDGDIPPYSGEAYYVLNGGLPYFTEDELTTEAFEDYDALDSLGRCTVTYACLGRELMPTEERESIRHVYPSGWEQEFYDFVDGEALYNRCHLIGYQLSGENDNERNLLTGTRYMNTQGMLPYEELVADYIRSTGNHVLYRVTPIFEGEELVARGVMMEAYSVEDNGGGICFNVYCYNVQPGVIIDYTDGRSCLDDSYFDGDTEHDYVLNTGSKKFHYPDCEGAADMNPANRQYYTGSRRMLTDQGYSPCGSCRP